MAIAVARLEDALPLAGTAFLGGAAQSWLVRKYPEYSWLLSLAMIAGGAYVATRQGIIGTVGLGVMAAGSAGLGMALMPVSGSPARGGMGTRMPVMRAPAMLAAGTEPVRMADSYAPIYRVV